MFNKEELEVLSQVLANATTLQIGDFVTSGTHQAIEFYSNTSPVTWTTGDEWHLQIIYQAA